jgi:hypothetical protein
MDGNAVRNELLERLPKIALRPKKITYGKTQTPLLLKTPRRES